MCNELLRPSIAWVRHNAPSWDLVNNNNTRNNDNKIDPVGVHAQAKQRLLSDQEHILWSTHQSMTQTQAHESNLQQNVAELKALQQTTALRVI